MLNHACPVCSGMVIRWGSFISCCKGKRDEYWMRAASNLLAVQKANPECNTTKILLLSASANVNDPKFGTVLLFVCVCEGVCALHTVHSPHRSLPLDLSQLLDSLVYSSLSKLDCSQSHTHAHSHTHTHTNAQSEW